jgi:hypothetical protein
MTTLYIFPAFDEQPTETICKITADSMSECELIATEHFGDTDRFAWSYTPMSGSEFAPDYTEAI